MEHAAQSSLRAQSAQKHGFAVGGVETSHVEAIDSAMTNLRSAVSGAHVLALRISGESEPTGEDGGGGKKILPPLHDCLLATPGEIHRLAEYLEKDIQNIRDMLRL